MGLIYFDSPEDRGLISWIWTPPLFDWLQSSFCPVAAIAPVNNLVLEAKKLWGFMGGPCIVVLCIALLFLFGMFLLEGFVLGQSCVTHYDSNTDFYSKQLYLVLNLKEQWNIMRGSLPWEDINHYSLYYSYIIVYWKSIDSLIVGFNFDERLILDT